MDNPKKKSGNGEPDDILHYLTPYELILGSRSGNLRNLIVLLTACGMVIGGAFLVTSSLVGGGIIDIKTAIIQGRLETGSIGILFAFMGFFFMLASLFIHRESRLTLKRTELGGIEINFKGGLTQEKAASIQKLLCVGSTKGQIPDKTTQQISTSFHQ